MRKFGVCAAAIVAAWLANLGGQTAWAAWPLSGNNARTDFTLTDNSGPWLISVATFSGSKAEAQAQELALDLRKDFGLKPYVYGLKSKEWRKKLNSAAPETGSDSGFKGEVVKANYQKKDRPDAMDYAVMVGDFSAVDDPSAQETLRKVKEIRPRSFDKHKEDSARILNEAKVFFNKKGGPLNQSFLAPNPRLPSEYFAPKGPDKFIYDMNKDFKYSLLNCKGKYSLRVATFRGSTLVDQAKIRETEAGVRELKSHLEKAGENAHALCESLRKSGVDAYEFHDRSSSIVTVGSFDSLGMPGGDGQPIMNPVLKKLLTDFGPETNPIDQSTQPRMVKIEIDGVRKKLPLDVGLEPILVPRRNIIQDYAHKVR